MFLFGETCEVLPPRLWPTPDSQVFGLSIKKESWEKFVTRHKAKKINGNGHGTPLAVAVRLISSAAAFPAKTSVSPERARALAASAVAYGRSSPELLAKYDRATSSWRTSQLCLDGELSEFSETWPRSGLMRNGIAYQLAPLVRLTDAIGSGLLPTPTEGDGKASGSRNTESSNAHPGISLTDAVRQDGGRGRMWQTPRASDGEKMSTLSIRRRLAGRSPDSLPDQIRAQTGSGSLNPTWVEWLMGFPLGWTDCEPSATPSSRRSRK
jgi:hypothetical protein